MIQFVPNALTLCNAALGLMALYAIARGEMTMASMLVAVALVIDFLDGFVARLLRAQSEIGAQLDSLADMVTFGAVPAFLLLQLTHMSAGLHFVPLHHWGWADWMAGIPAALYVMCAAYRLGFFNTDLTTRPHFLGVPTPAAAIVVMSIPLILEWQYNLNAFQPISLTLLEVVAQEHRWDAVDLQIATALMKPWTYQVLAVALAVLMVIRMPVINVKFKGLSWAENKWRYLLFIWALIAYLIFVIPYLGWSWLPLGLIDYLIVPIFMAGYFILSLIYAIFGARKFDT